MAANAILAIAAILILAMAAAADAGSYGDNLPVPELGSSCCREQKQEYLCLYADQIWAQPSPNDVLSAYPQANTGNAALGYIRSDYWPLKTGNAPDATVVGHLQGHHSAFLQGSWSSSFNILFQDDKFKGSSLEVRGPWVPENPFEWAILGGTGQLTLAQGVVYGNTVSIDGNHRVLQLCINVFYRPIQKPY